MLSLVNLEDSHLFYHLDWSRDLELANLLGRPLVTDLSLEHLTHWLKSLDSRKGYWAQSILYNGVPIGMLELSKEHGLPFDNAVEIGWFIGERDARGKGLGLKALVEGLEYAFSELGVSRVIAVALPFNKVAQSCLSRADFFLTKVSPQDYEGLVYILERERFEK